MPKLTTPPREIQIPRPNWITINVPIRGRTPLIQNRFGNKAAQEIEDKHIGKARKKKTPKVPEELWKDAMHVYSGKPGAKSAKYGIPAESFAKAMVGACRQVDGLTMTLAKVLFHVIGDGPGDDGTDLVLFESDPPIMRRDWVRNATGVVDLRYRPEFRNWSTVLHISFNADMLTDEQVAHLVALAGFGGVGERRPSAPKSSGGTYGMWEVVTNGQPKK